VPLERLLPLFTTGPARIGGLGGGGRLAAGEPAHVVAFDPDAAWIVDVRALQYRNKVSPWNGRTLRGLVRTTWVHGAVAWDGERVVARVGRELLADTEVLR
jgi:allantoinase